MSEIYVYQIKRKQELKQVNIFGYHKVDGVLEEIPVYQVVLPERTLPEWKDGSNNTGRA